MIYIYIHIYAVNIQTLYITRNLYTWTHLRDIWCISRKNNRYSEMRMLVIFVNSIYFKVYWHCGQTKRPRNPDSFQTSKLVIEGCHNPSSFEMFLFVVKIANSSWNYLDSWMVSSNYTMQSNKKNNATNLHNLLTWKKCNIKNGPFQDTGRFDLICLILPLLK